MICIIRVCIVGVRRRRRRAWAVRNLNGVCDTEYLLDVVAPDEGSKDVREEIGTLQVVLPSYIPMRNSLEYPDWLERQHRNDIAAK